MNESKISRVGPDELEIAKSKMISIRFDCYVKMFDCAIPMKQSNILNPNPKPGSPQWFKNEIKLTMEMVEFTDPYNLGLIIKQAFHDLKRHIELVEAQSK